MPKPTFQQKRDHLHSEKKRGKKYYTILIVLLALNFLFNTFIDPDTIGHDSRYNLYIIILPLLLGILVLAWYRREFIRMRTTTAKTTSLKILTAGFFLLEGVF